MIYICVYVHAHHVCVCVSARDRQDRTREQQSQSVVNLISCFSVSVRLSVWIRVGRVLH